MKKRSLAFFLTVALVVVLSFGQQALASWTLYDEFNGSSIDAAKWNIAINSGFSMSVNGENLVTSGNGAGSGIYATPRGNLFATLDGSSINGAALSYFNYSSNNTGSNAAGVFMAVGYFLFTGDAINDYYIIERLTNAKGSFIWAGHIVGETVTTLKGIPSSADSGSLGIVGTATGLEFIYGDSNYSNWVSLFSTPPVDLYNPTLMIGAGAGNNGFTTAEIGSVYVRSVPLPAAAWLLAPGLLGIAGLRRRFGK